jgi:DNA-binding NtrC family response regulator/uroporphyrinogen-III synthase
MNSEAHPNDSRPLAGRTVMITRAAAQSAEFAAALEGYGARVVSCPTIEIVEPETYAPLDQAIENLYGYDWLIFTSVNGVDFFFKRFNHLNHDVSELDELRVCAIGEATAVRLSEAFAHVDVVPQESKAEGAFAALENYLGGRRQFAGLNFLIPRASVARDFLPHALEDADARVDTVEAYRTVAPRATERARVEALLVGGGIDCVTFTSASTVRNFAQLFDTNDLSRVIGDARVACIGDVTAEAAEEFGLRVHVKPRETTTAALARAVAEVFAALASTFDSSDSPSQLGSARASSRRNARGACDKLLFVNNGRVLIVDDDPAVRENARVALVGCGFEIDLAADGESALARVAEFRPSVVLADVLARGLDGFALLRELRERHPEIGVILMSREASVESALRAVREEGALDYFSKPLDGARLCAAVERAIEDGYAHRSDPGRSNVAPVRDSFGKLIGKSAAMQRVYTLVEQVASSSASVLITGESGTGKEMVAHTIHDLSPRRDAEFVAVNCAAIPETLMESELFGHERGAFTGAAGRRQGCFELANQGTLLLDEIAEMPPLLQAKLLRVLEERTVRRLGGSHEIPVDVRVLAATNRDPREAVSTGVFREDLLYRLNVIEIHLPPLRQRKEDLPLLAASLIATLAARHGRPARKLSHAALEALRAHHWQGNVRELRNVIERAVIICSGDVIERHHIAPYPLDQRTRPRSEDTLTLPVGTPLEEVERRMIMRTLEKTDNNKTRAAELLQISLKTLHNKLRSYRERGLMGDGAGETYRKEDR